ncbi:IclR family transcriptional regulator [Streptomyces sp. NPDC004609]|uniref:IclR family transcriptional regulator n=1 Tax=Streptomyces sp. NPDC004609 TaxID=3364704 RepID=UPI0036811B98
MSIQPGRPKRSAVDRTFSVLSAFDQRNQVLTLSDISRRSGLPVATVHRIVAKLHSRGALERAATGEYSIGLRLWEIGTLAPRGSVLREAALPHLMTFRTQATATVILAVRDGTETFCLEMISDGRGHRPPLAAPGGRAPLHTNAPGLVLLAHAGPADREEVCSLLLRPTRRRDGVTYPALRGVLGQVRRQGYAVTGHQEPGRTALLAAPVRAAGGMVVAALGAVRDSGPEDRPELLPLVLATADAISEQLAASTRGSLDTAI